MVTLQHPVKTAWWLIRSELYKFNKNIHQTFLDMLIPAVMNAFVCGYILPHIGLPERWSGLVTVGEIVFFCAGIPFWRFGNKWIMEHESTESVTFELTLPLPPSYVLMRLVVGWWLQTMLTNSLTLFVAKLLLGDRFDWSYISWPRVFLMYLIMSFCFCIIAAMATFYFMAMYKVWRFWDRLIFPVSLVSIDFSWATAWVALKPLAYVMLAIPYTYGYEGMRAAVLGQQGFMNYWLCCAMLLVVSGVLWCGALHFFKKNLDCV
jgi:hypothetical protein